MRTSYEGESGTPVTEKVNRQSVLDRASPWLSVPVTVPFSPPTVT
jgi:hypothetical protein